MAFVQNNIYFWSDASPWAGHALNVMGFSVNGPSQRDVQINWLDIIAAKLIFQVLVGTSDTTQPYLDNMTTQVYIRKIGGTHSYFLHLESLRHWKEAI